MPSTRRELLQGLTQPIARALELPDDAPAPSLAVHAANRLAFGPEPGDVAAIEAMGHEAYLAQQLNPAAIPDTACDAALAAVPRNTLTMTPAQLFDYGALTWSQSLEPFRQVRHRTVIKRTRSKRQLFERMVEFWHDHFNVYAYDGEIRHLFPLWDDTLRTHALGNFHQLLLATARHPVMLRYLDNFVNTNGGPNENYARELVELHTMGAMHYRAKSDFMVGGVFDQAAYLAAGVYIDDDVYEGSRALTGWSFDRTSGSAGRGTFLYNHDNHDRFQKIILGNAFANDRPPLEDGERFVEILADHPSTARHLALKLCRRFVSDHPSEALVQAVADLWHAQKDAPDQIAQVLAFLLSTDEFKDSRATKLKRPSDWLCSMMRALGIHYWTHDSFYWLYDPFGQPLFLWAPPDGAPDEGAYWNTTNGLLRRWRWILNAGAGGNSGDGLVFSVAGIMPPALVTPREIATFWRDRVLAREVSTTSMEGLVEFVADGRDWDLALPPDQITEKVLHTAALCVMTPEFMFR
jgi:uncharacterized protein (DUF1800 family)